MQSRIYDRGLMPMAPVSACLIFGIIVALYVIPERNHLQLLIGAWLGLLFIFLLYQRRKWAGWLAWVTISGAGFLLGSLDDERLNPSHLVNQNVRISGYAAEVLDLPTELNSGYRTLIKIRSVKTAAGWQDFYSRSLLYTSSKAYLHPGNNIIVAGAPEPVRKSMNAVDDSYPKYLRRQNIFFRHQPERSIRLLAIPKNFISLIRRQIATMQISCLRILDTYIPDPQVEGVMRALVLGVTDHIDPEINRAFAETGTLHVLAVSGMHISLIHSILLLVLYPATRIARLRWWVAGVSVFLLWIYGALTSFSPSVLRAVTMFSIAAIAKPQGKTVNIWNIYASALFLLLATSPMFITRIGFQLSFLAVAGIIWIQPAIENLMSPRNPIFRWIWSTVCISISAQVLTLPVTMSVFGTFPVYFIPANVLIIPLSNVALASGIVLMLCSWISVVAEWAGLVSTFSVQWMNNIAEFIAELPFNLLSMETISVSEAVILIGMVVSAMAFLIHRNISAPAYFMVCTVAWAAVELLECYNAQQRFVISVYHSPGTPTLSIVTKEKALILTTDSGKVPSIIHNSFQGKDIKWISFTEKAYVNISFGNHRLAYGKLPATTPDSEGPDWFVTDAWSKVKSADSMVIIDNRRLHAVRKQPIADAYVIAERGVFQAEGKLFGTWNSLD